MKFKGFKRLMALMMAAALVVENAPASIVMAEETAGTEAVQQEDELVLDEDETEESSESDVVLPEEQEETEAADSTDAANPQEEQKEDRSNSWRYKDGEWIVSGKSGYARSSSQAWSKVDGKIYNDQNQEIEGAVAKGIDVSKWNGDIDWKKVKASDVDYAIIRCGYGNNETSQDDPYWKTNADACTKAGIPFGTYIYSYADSVKAAKSEAEHVLRLIDGYDLSYPVYYDLEQNSVREKLSSAEIAKVAETFCSIIEDAGYDVAVYANKDWFTNYLTDPYFDTVDHWVAQYNSNCTYQGEYTMWQCTDSGAVDGISGNVDLNVDFGTAQEDGKPEAVKNLKASSVIGAVNLSWSSVKKVDGYLVYGIHGDGKYGYLGMTRGTSYSDKKAYTSDYNYYWVFAYRKDTDGNMVAGAAPEKYVYGKAQRCKAVTDLKASSVSGGVKLTWTKSTGAEGYLVYGIRGEGSYEYIGMTTTGTSFTDKKALKKEYNFYWVFPYYTDSNGNMVAGETAHYVYGRAK